MRLGLPYPPFFAACSRTQGRALSREPPRARGFGGRTHRANAEPCATNCDSDHTSDQRKHQPAVTTMRPNIPSGWLAVRAKPSSFEPSIPPVILTTRPSDAAACLALWYLSKPPAATLLGLERNKLKGIAMSDNFANPSAVMAFLAIPSEVIWSYFVGGTVLVVGLLAIFFAAIGRKARGSDKLILFGPLFYAAPIAAFGTEHFTLTKAIASIMPAWIPWHPFWVYFVGAFFIAAALSLVTGIQACLSASLLALTFFLFVALMHAPGWAHHPRNRFAPTFALREISFSGGALALAASLTRERGAHILATIARYFVAIPVLLFSLCVANRYAGRFYLLTRVS